MKKFYFPTNDVVFKLLFSKTENSDLLISFLTAVLQPKSPITSTTVLNPELPKGTADDKSVILDVAVKLSDGSKVDVEMQVDNRKNLRKRIPFYLARLHQSQLGIGKSYHKIAPTASIVVLAYNETPEENFHTIYEMRERNSHRLFTDDLRIHLIELLKVEDYLADHPTEKPQEVVFWTRFFNAKTQNELEELAMERPIFERAHEALQFISSDPETQQMIDDREKAYVNYITEMEGNREEGRQEGIEEGIKKHRHEVISTMHSKGMTPEQIASILDLELQEVAEILAFPRT